MKLLSCNIYGFGAITDFKYSFTDGVNVICEDNGWGKSTFAAFIRIMLYGFNNEKAKELVNRERYRFKPWTGEEYGGELIIESEGVKYCIKKKFGSKPDKDETQIIDPDTGLIMKDMPDYIGEKLFGINSESFERTAFISQQDCTTSVNGSINGKLGNLVDNTDDINNYEKVMATLKKELNSGSPDRATGELYKLNNEVATLEQETREIPIVENSLKELAEKRNAVSKILSQDTEKSKDLGKVMSAQSEYNEVEARKEQYEKLIKDLSEREENLANIYRYFPNGVPQDDSVEKKIEELGELSQLSGQLDTLRLSREEKQDLAALKEYFSNKIPTQEEIIDIYNTVQEMSELRERIEAKKMRREDKERLEELSEKFKNGAPEFSEINSVQEAIADRTDLAQIVNQKETRLRMLCDRDKERHDNQVTAAKARKSLFITIGVLLLLGGAATAFLVNPLCGIAAGAGLIFIILALVTKTAVEANEEINEILETIDKEKSQLKETNEIIDDFKERYPWDYVDSQLAFSVHEIKLAVEEYNRLKNTAVKDDTAPLIEQMEKDSRYVEDFIRIFEDAEVIREKDYGAYLHKIETNKIEIDRLKTRDFRTEELESGYIASKKRMEAFIMSNAIKSDDYGAALKVLSERITKYKSALSEKEEAQRRKKAFEDENPDYESLLAVQKPGGKKSIVSLDEERCELEKRIEENREYLASYEKQMEEKRTLLDELREKEEYLEELKNKKAYVSKQYVLKEKTAHYLEQAKINFSNKYTNPVKDGFVKYYNLLSEDEGESFNIDANISLKKDIKGQLRSTDTLSRGQQDKAGISMRMGLVDAMYRDEKPFLIFDDPFTNLDDMTLDKAMDFINKVSDEYQLLYFTCSEQRKPL